MATCEKKVITQPKYEYVLTLSFEEATILRRLCRKVGGDPNGPRGYVDMVGEALEKAGVPIYEGSVGGSFNL